MGMTREELNTAVTAELAGVLTLAGFANTDTSGAMKEVLDNAFRALGVPQNVVGYGTVADGDETKAIAYLSYFVYSKAVANTTGKMAVAAGSAKAALEQQHLHLRQELARYLAQAQAFGLQVPGNGQSAYIPVPYAGGVDAADYQARADDTSRVPPLFSTRDLPNAMNWGGEPW